MAIKPKQKFHLSRNSVCSFHFYNEARWQKQKTEESCLTDIRESQKEASLLKITSEKTRFLLRRGHMTTRRNTDESRHRKLDWWICNKQKPHFQLKTSCEMDQSVNKLWWFGERFKPKQTHWVNKQTVVTGVYIIALKSTRKEMWCRMDL